MFCLVIKKKSNLINLFWVIMQYFTRDAAVHTKDGFNVTVKEACREQKSGWVTPFLSFTHIYKHLFCYYSGAFPLKCIVLTFSVFSMFMKNFGWQAKLHKQSQYIIQMCNALWMNSILLQIYISRLNVAKIIVVGDVGVGKTCLINR